jgi:hypothetical protein
MISLNNRPLNVSNGTLLVSLSNGRIQVWSHHDNSKCYIADFNAIHVADDVSKWLIDVHSPNFFHVLILLTFSLFLFLTFFSLRMHNFTLLNKNFYTTRLDKNLCKQKFFTHFLMLCNKKSTQLDITIYMKNTSVTAMKTDSENCYLFTGSSLGYIKAWMIVNFWYVFNVQFCWWFWVANIYPVWLYMDCWLL